MVHENIGRRRVTFSDSVEVATSAPKRSGSSSGSRGPTQSLAPGRKSALKSVPQAKPNHTGTAEPALTPGPVKSAVPSSASTAGHTRQIPVCPWLDGPEYEEIYEKIGQQTFDGYTCIEKEMIGPSYQLPLKSLERAKATQKQKMGKKGSQTPSKSLTLGEAIQNCYMQRLHEINKLLPMTKAYEYVPPLQSSGSNKQGGTVWLGDVVDSVNFSLLKQENITAMVSIHPQDFRSKGQEHHGSNGHTKPKSPSPIIWRLRLELDDSKEAALETELERVFRFVRGRVTQGQNVLIHCIAGLSRSVAVVLDFIQRINMEQWKENAGDTPNAKYSRMLKSRQAAFANLAKKRPGITTANFELQLNESARKLCGGIPPQLDTVAAGKQKSKEHGGGGYIGDTVATVFYLYHLRPTQKVFELFEARQKAHKKKQEKLGQGKGAFSFPDPLIEWFKNCKTYKSPQPAKS